MAYNPEKHRRRSIRLRDYDYSRVGLYFVTVCVQDFRCLFGTVRDGQMYLNEAGLEAQQCWLDIPLHYPRVELHQFQVMPNHVHGILGLRDEKDFPVVERNSQTLRRHVGNNQDGNIGELSQAALSMDPQSLCIGVQNFVPQRKEIEDESLIPDIPQNEVSEVHLQENENGSPLSTSMDWNDDSHGLTYESVDLDHYFPGDSKLVEHIDIAQLLDFDHNNVDPAYFRSVIRGLYEGAMGTSAKRNQFQKIIPRSLGAIVRGYKIGVTNWFRSNTDIHKVWQRDMFEHIIRDREAYLRISAYIANNPKLWKGDKFYQNDL